ncbi:MAG: NAD-dependent epimerase/dehydratase family protein [Chloroflexota bacterium]
MTTSARVVVFGSGGFVGAHVADAVSAGGHTVVRATREIADLADRSAIAAVLEPGDIVVNAAGYADVTDRSEHGVRRLRESNVLAVGNLADAGLERGVSRIIHISSVAAMGRLTGSAITEARRGPITTPYAQSKRDAEERLAGYADRLAVTVLRPTSVFGEGRGLAAALCRIARLPVIPLPGGGRDLIPFTDVGNVAAAVAVAIGQERTVGGTFIVGDDRSYPLVAIIRELAIALDRPSRTVPVPRTLVRLGADVSERLAGVMGRRTILDRTRAETMTTSVEYSIEAFRQATGFVPPVALSTSARRIAAWYLQTRAAAASIGDSHGA